jgi:monomeric isocitrate dehydrogenase
MWLLKSPLDQNSKVIYQKFNDDFKSHINFGMTKLIKTNFFKEQGVTMGDESLLFSISLKADHVTVSNPHVFGPYSCDTHHKAECKH